MSSSRDLIRKAESALDAGKPHDAMAFLKQIPVASLTNAEDLNHVGLVYYRLDMFEPAERLFERALSLRPLETAYINNFGLALAKLKRRDEAETQFHKAGKLRPDDATTCRNLAALYFSWDRLEKAKTWFEKEIALNPQSASAHVGLALVAERGLHSQEARARAESALTLEPGNAEATAVKATLALREKRFDEALAIAEVGMARHPRHVRLHYEMGHALHALGRYAEAMESFIAANRLDDRKLVTRVHYLEEIAGIGKFLKKIAARALAKRHPVTRDLPLFVTGSPRSGTTLAAQMLGMHPALINAGELEHLPVLYREANRLLGSPNHAGKILESVWHPDNKALRERLARRYREMLANFENVPPGAWVIDKMPSNARRLGLIAAIAPGAGVVNIIRDGREVAFSAFTQQFREYTWHTHNLENALTEWQTTIEVARRSAEVLQLNYHEIVYEKLIADPENELRKTLEFLGLPWDPACLEFHKSRGAVHTASYYQVKQKLFTSSLAKSRLYPEAHSRMTEFARDMLARLGYEILTSP